LNDKFHEAVKYIYIWYVAKKILYDHHLGYIKTRDVSHCGLAIHIKETLGKRRIMETRIFLHAKYINLQKNPLKETKILQDIITL
jgi:hypothetical protein